MRLHLAHLTRRFLRSLDPRPPSDVDLLEVRAILSPSEFELWSSLPSHDRRHSLDVLRRFDSMVPDANAPERAAALLHDVGKVSSSLGRIARVAATIVGPRGRRFREYHDHERIGADLLHRSGSDTRTVGLVSGVVDDPVGRALRAADEV